ncbi:rhodanese-like domain-containing protein [Mangrovimonas aestuarii]|uniref:rhodanese-like domain-containing protein n=1 Tax=Mangrovimonas aestuarii TaxID=3018443 RepID=UPI0023788C4D|nr:rhodanese-like domain-containing protein [Mangrovimonas aestuarii]
MGILSSLFGNKSDELKALYENGAVIIDVRSAGEYAGGAIPGSKNIPLQQIAAKAKDIKKLNKPVITCCASGMRSGSAAGVLKGHGIEVINGGGWLNLSRKLELV